ncbi:hypothetical protein O181_119962 [Austropuccinia psidii MF-1]|uniref:Uncharacterized protein n=1 Tax=Austropuccinia psidii MF-1 TaxID=1389203 RepID=A0A9Q3KIB0_9BASI|nr:hypothetical protein [Austropuccinia psidii MF-1]
MSYKLTELPESSPSAPPPSVLCGYGILIKLASSGIFDTSQTYDGYKAVGVLDHSCTKCLAKGKDCFQHYNPRSSKCHFFFVGKKPCHHTGPLASNVRRYLWSNKDVPYGKEFPFSEAPNPYGTSEYSNLTGSRQRDVARWPNFGRPIYSRSEVSISRINTEGVYSPSHTPARRFQIHIITSTPRTFQPTLANLPTFPPPASSSSLTSRPSLIPEVRPSPIPQSRNSPIVTSQKLQPVASSSRRREELSPFLFPAAQVFQQRECWPIQVTREDPKMASENQDTVARLLRRVDRNSRELIEYANYRTIPGTASEEMAADSSWY